MSSDLSKQYGLWIHVACNVPLIDIVIEEYPNLHVVREHFYDVNTPTGLLAALLQYKIIQGLGIAIHIVRVVRMDQWHQCCASRLQQNAVHSQVKNIYNHAMPVELEPFA